MTIDLELGIGLAFHTTDEGTIQAVPMLSDLENAFTNVRISNMQLINESSEKLEEILPTILDMVMPMLTDALAEPFDLVGPEDLMGFLLNIAPEDVTGVLLKNPMPENCATWIENDNGGHDPACYEYLSIFAQLDFDPNAATTSNMTNTSVRAISEVIMPDRLDIMNAGGRLSPHIIIETDGETPPLKDGELEYAYRVDTGSWSPFMAANRFKVSSPRLWLLGKHRIEVISRIKGDMWTMDRTPAVIKFTVDPTPPEVFIRLDYEGDLLITAQDEITPKERLEYSYSVNGAEFTAFSFENRYNLASYMEGDAGVWLRVKARDEMGNVGLAELGSKEIQIMGNAAPVKLKKTLRSGVQSIQGETPEPGGCISR